MDKIKLTIAGYDKIAKHWDGTRRHGWSEVYQYIDSNISNFFSFNNKKNFNDKSNDDIYSKKLLNILDLGCGNGRLIDLLKKKIYWPYINYTGIDPSIELINICKDRYNNKNIFEKISSDNIEFKINDGINIPLGENSMNMIISLAVLHHIPKEYQYMWLSEMYRVIKKDKDSKIILTVWIQDSKNYTANTSKGELDCIKHQGLEIKKSSKETLKKTVHQKISENEMMMGFAQYENIRYVYLFEENELVNLLSRNKFKVLEKYIDKRPNSDHKNLILILAPEL